MAGTVLALAVAGLAGCANPVNSPYMYHCHLLWHEDSGLMGQFVVVGPGQTPVPPGDPYSDH